MGRAEDPAASTRAGRSGGSCSSESLSQAACAEEKGQQREQAEVFPAVQGMLSSSSTRDVYFHPEKGPFSFLRWVVGFFFKLLPNR